MSTTIFQIIGSSLDNTTKHFITSTSAEAISNFTPVAISGIGLFITCYGYLIIMGKIEEPFTDFLLKCIKIIFISALALNTPTYLKWVVSSIDGLQHGLAYTLSKTDSTLTIYGILDTTLNKSFILIKECSQKGINAGWTDLGNMLSWFVYATLISIGTLVLVITGGVIILIGTILLKIMLAIGPIFIMCLMWPVTAKFFDAWFSQVVTYVLKVVLVTTVMTLAVQIFDKLIGDINLDSNSNKIETMLEIIVASFLLYKVILETGSVAAALAGGVSAAAMSIGQIASATIAPLKIANKIINPTSTRTSARTGTSESGTRFQHIARGNTMLNPAYRQRLMENISKGWSRKKE